MTRNESHFTMLKTSNHQEDIFILNMHAPIKSFQIQGAKKE